MTYGCEVKRNLGKQLGNMRLQKNETLHTVAQKNNISPQILATMESGNNIGWKYYKILLKYYNCELKIVCND